MYNDGKFGCSYVKNKKIGFLFYIFSKISPIYNNYLKYRKKLKVLEIKRDTISMAWRILLWYKTQT